MADIVNQLPCRSCSYDLSGLAAARCPECGSELPPRREVDHTAAKMHAAAHGLKCRHCTRPLADMIDGVCSCGAKYQLASTRTIASSRSSMSLIDGVTVVAAIVGCAIALLAFIFTGAARNSDPKWGAVILAFVPAIGLSIAILMRRFFGHTSNETRSMVSWFFIVISAVCLVGAVVILS